MTGFFLFVIGIILQPISWVLTMVIAAALVRSSRWKNRCCLGAVILVLVFTNPLLHHSVTNVWEPEPLAIDSMEGRYDDAIVLGGFARLYASPQDRLHLNNHPNRFSQAIELYHRGKVQRLIFVSGCYTASDPDLIESDIAVRTAQLFGVPESDVVALTSSLNTRENALECLAFLNDKRSAGEAGMIPERRLLVITSAFHTRRAAACFSKAGMTVDLFPTDHGAARNRPGRTATLTNTVIPNPSTIVAWNNLFREWFAMVFYKLKRWI